MTRAAPFDLLYAGTLTPHPGGSAVAAQTLLLGLSDRGWKVRCIAPVWDEVRQQSRRFDRRYPQLHVHRYRLETPEIATEVAPTRRHRRQERQGVQALLSRRIGSRKPDLVISGRETFAWYVPEIAHANRVPCCQWFQGGPTMRLAGGGFPPDRAEALVRILRSTQLRVVVGHHMARMLSCLGIGDTHVIPNGIDLQHFRPRPVPEELRVELRVKPTDFIVAHCSNLKRLKHAEDVVRAIASSPGNKAAMVFLCIGEGDARHSTALQALCARKGVRSRFPGWVPHRRIPDFLNLADVVVMPSDFEGHPLVFLETMACARVLVASDIEASRSLVRDGWDACLFPPRNVSEISAILGRLAGNRASRARIGRRARESVKRYSQRKMVDRYDTLFRAFLDRHTAPATLLS